MRKVTTHLILLLLFCIGTGVFVFWMTNDKPAVESLVRVARLSNTESFNDSEYQVYCETQAALLRSNFVITAALRDNDVNSLPLFQDRKQPVQWLASLIETRSSDSELIGVRLNIPFGYRSNHNVGEWELVLDKIVDAYLKEVVNKERLEQVAELSKLRKRYVATFEHVRKKQDEISALGEQLGIGQNADIKKDMSIRRIERYESKLLELELELVAAESLLRDAMGTVVAVKTPAEESAVADAVAQTELAEETGEELAEEPTNAIAEELAEANIEDGEAGAPEEANLPAEIVAARSNVRSLQSQVAVLKDKRDLELEELERFGGTIGDLEARTLDLNALRKDLLGLRASMQVLEVEIDSEQRVSVVQAAIRTNVDFDNPQHIFADAD